MELSWNFIALLHETHHHWLSMVWRINWPFYVTCCQVPRLSALEEPEGAILNAFKDLRSYISFVQLIYQFRCKQIRKWISVHNSFINAKVHLMKSTVFPTSPAKWRFFSFRNKIMWYHSISESRNLLQLVRWKLSMSYLQQLFDIYKKHLNSDWDLRSFGNELFLIDSFESDNNLVFSPLHFFESN